MAQQKAESDNLKIKQIIKGSPKPFFIGRIAGCELKVAYYHQLGRLAEVSQELKELENNAGIYAPTQDSLTKYVNALIKSYDHCTAIAEWDGKVFALTGEGQQFIAHRTPQIPKIDALALEPYYYMDNWMVALKGKRILVVHPFSDILSKQTRNFSSLFPNLSWFEDCTFQFLAPPLTLAGNHGGWPWDEHLEPFLKRISAIPEFDIALVAAGGYGMLISDYIFTACRKSVMYIGGALQLFFGVIGKRWFNNNDILKLVNDDWIRPPASIRPPNFSKVEKGCYW
jgi:hypothetical protein